MKKQNRLDKEYSILVKHKELDRIDGILSSNLDPLKSFYAHYQRYKNLNGYYSKYKSSYSKDLFYKLVQNEIGSVAYNYLKEGCIYLDNIDTIFVSSHIKLGIFVTMVDFYSKSRANFRSNIKEVIHNCKLIIRLIRKYNKGCSLEVIGFVGESRYKGYLNILLDYLKRSGLNIPLNKDKATRVLLKKLKFLYGDK